MYYHIFSSYSLNSRLFAVEIEKLSLDIINILVNAHRCFTVHLHDCFEVVLAVGVVGGGGAVVY